MSRTMFRIRTLLPIMLACATLGVGALDAGPAVASHSQSTFFEAEGILLNPSTRAKAIAQLEHLGVKALRVELHWHSVAPAPGSTKRPRFDATNPASYNWGPYDGLLAEAKRLGWQVLLTVTSPIPRWASDARNNRNLVTRPDDRQFEEFMTAVGRHYGSEVSLFAIWDEPNNPGKLRPQFNSNGTPASPRIYRGLFQAGYAGLRAAGIAHPKVLMGETAPFGFYRVNVRRQGRQALLQLVAPLVFLRDSLCLNTHYRKARGCGMLPITGYSQHPYSGQVPFRRTIGQNDVTMGVLSRLTSAVTRAGRAHAIPANTPVYLTEFGIQSKPDLLGVPWAMQAEYYAVAERIAWSNPHVAAFSQYELVDDPPRVYSSGRVNPGFSSGLETYRGRRKPLYYGFPIPLVVSRAGRGYSLWGYVRPAEGATRVRVLAQPWHSHRWHTLRVVRTDSLGYWTFRSAARVARWRVSWRSPHGAVYTGPPTGATSPFG